MSCLGDAIELQLEEHVLEMESRGFGLTRQDVHELAYELSEQNKNPDDFNLEIKQAGRFWLEGFLKRHPRIAIRKAEGLSRARAIGMNRPEVRQGNK